jgi:hypothetical protein
VSWTPSSSLVRSGAVFFSGGGLLLRRGRALALGSESDGHTHASDGGEGVCAERSQHTRLERSFSEKKTSIKTAWSGRSSQAQVHVPRQDGLAISVSLWALEGLKWSHWLYLPTQRPLLSNRALCFSSGSIHWPCSLQNTRPPRALLPHIYASRPPVPAR